MDLFDGIDVQIIEDIRKVFAITKRLPPIATFIILQKLNTIGSTNQTELADALNMKAQSVSEHVKKLSDSGLIKKESSTEDRRSAIVTITEKGREELEGSAQKFQKHCDAFLSSFDQEEKELLLALLNKMINSNESSPNRVKRVPHVKPEQPAAAIGSASSAQQILCTCSGHRCIVSWQEDAKEDGVQGTACKMRVRDLSESCGPAASGTAH